MISFVNDYSEGACEEILERLAATNHEQSVGYGLDPYCERAAEKIRQAIECDDCDVHFLVGGTQCNKTVIAAALRPHEAVICAESGHINVHESGAIENSGHKVLYAPSADGRLQCADVEAILAKHTDEHMVKPAMVYVSDATEIGTFYTYAQLKALSECCHAHGLYLFLDGARLGNALCAEGNDLTLPQLAQLCDVFYIGGTKNGALFGEALVIVNDALKPDFRYHIKQNGAMLAKGRLLGIQFDVLMEGDRYLRLAAHANAMAQKIAKVLKECEIPFLIESKTNQIFPILPDALLARLRERFVIADWERVDATHTAVRIITSWDTQEAAAEELCRTLRAFTQ